MRITMELPFGYPHTTTRPQGNLEVTKPYIGRYLQALTCCGLGQPEAMKTPGMRVEGRWKQGELTPWNRGVPIPFVTLGEHVCVALFFPRATPKKEKESDGPELASSPSGQR